MQAEYERIIFIITEFDTEDVITTSGGLLPTVPSTDPTSSTESDDELENRYGDYDNIGIRSRISRTSCTSQRRSNTTATGEQTQRTAFRMVQRARLVRGTRNPITARISARSHLRMRSSRNIRRAGSRISPGFMNSTTWKN